MKIIDLNEPLVGKFLISSPAMGDNRFFKSVIFIAQENDGGSMGVVINKASAHTFNHIVKSVSPDINTNEMPINNSNINISLGGPVSPNNLFIIHTNDYKMEHTIDIQHSLAMTNQPQIIIDLYNNNGPKNALIGIGCSTWEKGQLKHEINNHMWIMLPFSFNNLFYSLPHNKLYDSMLNDIGINNTNPAMIISNKHN